MVEVASRTLGGEAFEFELADFLHEFQYRGDLAVLAAEPDALRGYCEAGAVYDAYLAAAAASLASRLQCPAPAAAG